MILILTSYGDHLADLVIDWLVRSEVKVVRINDEELLVKKKFFFQSSQELCELVFNNKVKLSDVTVAWYRKFGVFRDSELFSPSIKQLGGALLNFYSYEFKGLVNVLYYTLSNYATWLADPQSIDALPKIKQLQLARMAGLLVPECIITNDWKEAAAFLKSHKNKCIIKPIAESEVVPVSNKEFPITPEILDLDSLKIIMQRRFFPSLIQEYIEKEIELRIFYIDGICYPMAIFSQLDEQTKIDFRKYNSRKPNRFVPYQLPELISFSIKKFMDSVNLNTGSIDIIKTTTGQYVFLEVNPTGQFGMVSIPCNYFLEEKIAQSLLNKANSCH